jgi:hypothetical protein
MAARRMMRSAAGSLRSHNLIPVAGGPFRRLSFSRWGNLVTTLEVLVNGAPQGYFANELQQVLHVEVKEALLRLVEQRRIARQQVTGLFLYCSQDAALRRRQVLARQALVRRRRSTAISKAVRWIWSRSRRRASTDAL